MYHRPYLGRCRPSDHGRIQVYRDGLVTGVCAFGIYVEVPR